MITEWKSTLNGANAATIGFSTNPPRFPLDQRTRAGAFFIQREECAR